MNKRILTLLATLLLAASTCHAQESANSKTARATFEEMRKAYASLNSFSMTASSYNTLHATNKMAQQPDAQFFFRAPNRFAIFARKGKISASVISTGATVYMETSLQHKTYTALPMPPVSVGRAALMQYRFTGPFITPLLATVDPFAEPWGESAKSWRQDKPQVFNGVAVERVVVILSSDGKQTLTYLIGVKDHLLRRARLAYGSQFSLTETYSNIKVNSQIPSEKFTFTPPPGAHQKLEETHWDKNLKVGSTPPAFEANDLNGNTVSLENLKGKVVLLDFWATWCGPCMEELPHVKAAYGKFHNKGFEIIGVSLDQNREDLDAFLKTSGIAWPQIFDGKMFKSEVISDFKLTGIPFSVLIGRDGKIAAINPRTLFLEPAIEKALAQK